MTESELNSFEWDANKRSLVPSSVPLALISQEEVLKIRETFPCRKYDPEVVFNFADIMRQICMKSGGVGLSAIQVGIPLKLCIVYVGPNSDDYDIYIDAEYEGFGDKLKSIEGCLSIPGKSFHVSRYKNIKVKGYRGEIKDDKPIISPVTFEEDGFGAIVLQHEIDHQNLILISDIGESHNLTNLCK